MLAGNTAADLIPECHTNDSRSMLRAEVHTIMKLTTAEKVKRSRQKAEADPNIDTAWAEYRAKEFEKRKQAEKNSPDCASEPQDRSKDEPVDKQ